MHAISEIAPEKILAGSGSPIWCVNLNGYQVDGTRIAGLFFFNGGMGRLHLVTAYHAQAGPLIFHRRQLRRLNNVQSDSNSAPYAQTLAAMVHSKVVTVKLWNFNILERNQESSPS